MIIKLNSPWPPPTNPDFLDIQNTSSWCFVLFPPEMPLRWTCHLPFALFVRWRPWTSLRVRIGRPTAFFFNYCIELHRMDRPSFRKSSSYWRTCRLFSIFAHTSHKVPPWGRACIVSKGDTIVESLWHRDATIACQQILPLSLLDVAEPVHILSGVGEPSGAPDPSAQY